MIDRASETWITVDEWLRAQIEASRAALESPGIDQRAADMERGRIQAMRSLQRMAAPQAPSVPRPQSAGIYA